MKFRGKNHPHNRHTVSTMKANLYTKKISSLIHGAKITAYNICCIGKVMILLIALGNRLNTSWTEPMPCEKRQLISTVNTQGNPAHRA